METLTDGQLHALRNLAEKRAGNETPFIRLADAQQLTELGFASRSRQGWDITAAGGAYLTRLDGGAPSGELII